MTTRFGLLGSLEVSVDGRIVALGSPAQRRLLAMLAVHAGEVVSAERLADVVWSGEPPPSASGGLQNHVYKLRNAIGADRIVTRPPGYLLVAAADEVDAREFERLVLAAEHATPTEAVGMIDDARALWRGPPLAEFEYEDWARPTVVGLEGLHLAAIERRLDALVQLGRSVEAVASAEAHVAAEPLREAAVGLLMRALASEGRTPDALRAFERFRKALAEETGMSPSPALVEMERSLLAGSGPAVSSADRRVAAVTAADIAAATRGVPVDIAAVAGPPVDGARPTMALPTPAARPAMESHERRKRPSGVVTFLFTDIEGSTELWSRESDAMRASLELHDAIVGRCMAAGGGHVFSTFGDSYAVAFDRPLDAVNAAVALQTELRRAAWPPTAPIRVRIGLHLGVADERADNYFGAAVSLAARVEQAAHGGQIVITEALAAHVRQVDLVPLGEHRLRGFDEPVALLAVVVPGQSTDHPPLRTERVGASSLPTRRTSLIGREDAVVEIRQLLRSHRLVTLTGAGGIGKTSLAVEVAARESTSSQDAVFFVDLSGVPKGGDVTLQFFVALGIRPDGSDHPAQQLAHALAERSALLCVDNCEHVLDQVAEMVAVLAPCRHLRALATSREPLSVPGERVWRVPTLPIRPTAVQLFVTRAADIDSSFGTDRLDEATIAEICQRVDGLPLAIELAASRVRTLSLADIRDGLDHRFRLLGANTRGAPLRHRTLEAVIGWSYALLEPDQRAVLRRLGIFEDSFDVGDVVGVTGLDEFGAIDALDALVSKSLVDAFWPSRSTGIGARGPARYRLLESLWSFARDRLDDAGERTEAQDRYLDHLVAIDGAPPDMRLLQAGSRLRVRSFANLRSAANWALDRGRVADATRLTLGRAVAVVENGAAHEGLAWLAGREHLSRADRLWALNGCAYLAMSLGELEQARGFLRECFDLADGEPFDAMPNAFGFAAMIDLQTDNPAALELMDHAIAFAPATPSGTLQLTFLHHVRGLVHLHARRWAAAIEDSIVAIDLTPPGSLLHGLGLVTRLVALTVLERSALFDTAFELGFGTADDDSLVADQGWNRRLLRFLSTEVSEDDSALAAALAVEALAPNGGPIGQRCADLLAVVVWRDDRGRQSPTGEMLVTAAVSSSAFGALATETLGRAQGWTDQEWPERVARISRAAQGAQSRATAIREAWRLREPITSGRVTSP